MRRHKKFLTWTSLILSILFTATFAGAQTNVLANQGKPGNMGAWPISGTVTVASIAAVGTYPVTCTTRANKVTSVGVAAGNTPSSQLANRYYIQLCVSLEETGNPVVKCRADGSDPAIGEASIGDTMRIGSCLTYAVTASVVPRCISDTAATAVTSWECGP